MEYVDSNSERTILFIGDQKANVYESKTISCVRNYVHKKLHSSDPDNWQKVLMLIKGLKKFGNLAGIVIDLSPRLLVRASLDEYNDVWKQIFLEIKEAKSLILIRKDVFDESIIRHRYEFDFDTLIYSDLAADKSINRDDFDRFLANKRMIAKEKMPVIREIIECVKNSKIPFIVYELHTGAVNEIVDFLDTIDPGILLRIYIPKGNFKEKQFDSFLKLFEEYMIRVEKKPFLIDQIRTDHGTIYIFKSHDKLPQSLVEKSIDNFYSFLDFAQNDIEKARTILLHTNFSSIEADLMLTEFNRSIGRIKLDLLHEFEKRIILLRQSYENKLFSNVTGSNQSQDQSIKLIEDLMQMKTFGDFQNNVFNFNFMSNPIINNDVNQSFIEETFIGDIHYGIEDKMFIDIIDKIAEGLEKVALKSELDILKDKSTPPPVKKTAFKKLGDFLSNKVLPKLGEAAFNLWIDYLKKTYLGL